MRDYELGTIPMMMVIQVKESQRQWEQRQKWHVVRHRQEPWLVSHGRKLLFRTGHILRSLGDHLQQVGSSQGITLTSRAPWAAEER